MTYVLRSPPMSHSEAEALSSALEGVEPLAGAVSIIEVDERQGLWRVEAYYAEEPTTEAVARLAVQAGPFAVERLEDADWVARSLRGLPPVRAGRFIVHGSHDRARLPPGGVRIEIDAGAAFGTGHHATTMGCLQAFDRVLKRGRPRSVLDVGSGTGVLAIAAARAVRARTTAVDIDPQAVRVTRANAITNGVPALLKARRIEKTPERAYARLGRFDVLFANILAGPLLALAPHLARKLAPGGTLILSGLTSDQERQVTAAYRNRGVILDGRIRQDEWSTLIFRRPERQRPTGGGLPGGSGQKEKRVVQRLQPQTIWWISLRLRPMSSSSRSSRASS